MAGLAVRRQFLSLKQCSLGLGFVVAEVDGALVKECLLQGFAGWLLFIDQLVDRGEHAFGIGATAAHGGLQFRLELHAVFQALEFGLEAGLVVGV